MAIKKHQTYIFHQKNDINAIIIFCVSPHAAALRVSNILHQYKVGRKGADPDPELVAGPVFFPETSDPVPVFQSEPGLQIRVVRPPGKT